VHQPVDVEPLAAEPWNVFWQASPQTTAEGTKLFDYLQ
jgi:hypothetical protein